MRNTDIADAFTELADRLALTDLKPYRYMAYRKAATLFTELGDSVAVLSEEGRLTELDGVGPAIAEKVADLLATGTFKALDEAREAVPDTLLELTRLPGVGPATAKKVYAAADGQSFEALLDQAAAGTLETGGGITKAVVEALAGAAARRAAGGSHDAPSLSGVPRDADGVPLPGPWFRRDQAAALVETTAALLDGSCDDLRPSGAYVRGCELVDELVLTATVADPAAAAAAVADLLASRGWELPSGAAPRSELLDGIDGAEVADLHLVSPAGFPVLLGLASPTARARADHRLAGPSAWVVREPEPARVPVPFELRERVLAGALAPADIPADLITVADLRGELHAHSDWSDGRAPIIEMARTARDRGDAYFCVTDHSAPYALVNGLDPDRIAAQAAEIAAANETLAAEHAAGDAPAFRVLRGSEVEIQADGSLGLPDAVLEQLDWVVASLHSQQRQSADVVFERMRGVVENPLVDAIGHPTSRRLLRRERTALDIDAFIALAAEHDVVLEINANPDRLDLDSAHAALALAAGVRLTINTDAHQPGTLDLRQHGVAVARRAGARARDVVNCLDVEALEASRRRHR